MRLSGWKRSTDFLGIMRAGFRIFCLWFLTWQASASPDPFPIKHEEKFLSKPFPLNDKATAGAGDFDDLNKLLQGAVIRLPDARVANDVVILDLRNIQCTNFIVDQILLYSDKVQESAHDTFETTQVDLTIEGLDMICFLDYSYTFIFTRYGSADLYSYDNSANVGISFTRQLLEDSPANSVSVQDCSPTINVNDLDFRGDIAAMVFDTVEKLMRNKVETEAEQRICQELNSLSKAFIAEMLRKADESLAQYYNVDLNPLISEKELNVPDIVKLMDLRDDSRATEKWLDKILAYAVDFATKVVTDENGIEDMNLNVFIRQNLLEDGALILDTNGLDILNNHNQFLDVNVAVDRLKIFGLDRIENFEPFIEIGRYTVQNKLTWSLLTVEIELTISIKGSTKEDSIFASPSSGGTEEKIKIKFGIQNVCVLLSILLAVDEEKLGALRLGSLLHSEKILDCLLSTVYQMQVSGLSLEAGDIQPPIMEGFVARGIDRIVSDFMDAAFLIYESAMLDAAPGLFNTVARKFLNGILDEYIRVDVTCFIPLRIGGSPDGFTDFRDLLLPPDQALAAGGMGTEPYGDLPYTLVSQLKQRFLADDRNGIPQINNLIQGALVKLPNETDAVIHFGDMLDWNTTVVVAGLEALVGVKILDVRVGNLDSFGSPLKLFEPVTNEANMINNSISFGVGAKPLRITARVVVMATNNGTFQTRRNAKLI